MMRNPAKSIECPVLRCHPLAPRFGLIRNRSRPAHHPADMHLACSISGRACCIFPTSLSHSLKLHASPSHPSFTAPYENAGAGSRSGPFQPGIGAIVGLQRSEGAPRNNSLPPTGNPNDVQISSCCASIKEQEASSGRMLAVKIQRVRAERV